MSASTSDGARILGRVRVPRTSGTPVLVGLVPGGSADHAEPGWSPRRRGHAETRTDPGRSTADAAASASTLPPAHHRPVGRSVRQSHERSVERHKREHIRRPDPLWTLPDDGKEDLQVVGHRQHRVRSAPLDRNSRYSSSSGTPRLTTGSPAGPTERIKHGLTVGIRVPFSPHGLPRSSGRMSAKITRLSSNCGSSTRFLATLRFLTYFRRLAWSDGQTRGHQMRTRALLFAPRGCFEPDRVACPRNWCNPISEDPVRHPWSDLPVTDTKLNPNTQHQEHRHDHSDLDGLDSARPFTPRGLVLSCLV